MYNILIVNGNSDYLRFAGLIAESLNFAKNEVHIFKASSVNNVVENIVNKDIKLNLVIFTGGEDVTPGLYGEQRGRYTGVNSMRDHEEVAIFNLFRDVPKLGICRGSQFLTVMNGGKLVQHVSGHGISGTHDVKLNKQYLEDSGIEANTLNITSTHHQMLFPFNLPEEEFEMIGYSSEKRSHCYLNGDNQEIDLPENFVESEIVFYPKTKSLGIQGHPEYMAYSSETIKNILKIIKTKLN